ncbi:MAG TPA: LytTR family DNA-binding domain-containing protein [Rhodothermales bacterium]|nr:LytTR family DNA-binding domain-containing protein [Rhodothermales bacterium]HRR09259.1 LytTR family DNA-binding domain-containing protein [Rhodothermales bacterium]
MHPPQESLQVRSGFDKGKIVLVAFLTMVPIALTIFQDYLEAHFRQYRFYFSESFLFSLIWWLFIPLLLIQYVFLKTGKITGWWQIPAFIVLPVLLHLLLYPALVWGISAMWYGHTFPFERTLQYALAEYPLIVLIVYGGNWLVSLRPATWSKTTVSETISIYQEVEESTVMHLQHLDVTENGIQIKVPTSHLIYLSAQTPYVCLHTASKKHLVHSSLRRLEQKLNPYHFVRIHKTTMVNMDYVTALKSRLNGDYDLTVQDGTLLRLSRNYAPAFKQALKNRGAIVSLPPTLQDP